MCQGRFISRNQCAPLVGVLIVRKATTCVGGGVVYWKLLNFAVDLQLLPKKKSLFFLNGEKGNFV